MISFQVCPKVWVWECVCAPYDGLETIPGCISCELEMVTTRPPWWKTSYGKEKKCEGDSLRTPDNCDCSYAGATWWCDSRRRGAFTYCCLKGLWDGIIRSAFVKDSAAHPMLKKIRKKPLSTFPCARRIRAAFLLWLPFRYIWVISLLSPCSRYASLHTVVTYWDTQGEVELKSSDFSAMLECWDNTGELAEIDFPLRILETNL